MDNVILCFFLFVLLSLNIASYLMYKKGRVNLFVSGLIVMILGPVLGFSSGALFLHFYDWSSGGTGEGAGYGGAFIGLLTIANGLLIMIIGIIRWMIKKFM